MHHTNGSPHLNVGTMPANAEIDAPKAFDELTVVHLTACPLSIQIDYATPPEQGKGADTHIKLIKSGQTGANDWGYLLAFGRDAGTPPASFTLSTITPGK